MGTKCEVEGCNGVYVTKTVSYCNLEKVHTDSYMISTEVYNQLENKKGYCAVVSQLCNVCNDDLNDRLADFINKHSHAFVN